MFTFCPNCPSIISPRILGKIGAVVGVPRACQKFWGFFCLVVCSSLPDGSGRLMEGPTWQTQNVNKAEKHTPKVDACGRRSLQSDVHVSRHLPKIRIISIINQLKNLILNNEAKTKLYLIVYCLFRDVYIVQFQNTKQPTLIRRDLEVFCGSSNPLP